MTLHTINIGESAKADAIVRGDRPFDIIQGLPGINIGDYIHYTYVVNDTNIKHVISDTVYAITSIEDIYGHGKVVGLKPVMGWQSYAINIVDYIFKKQCKCEIWFNGANEYLRGKITSYCADKFIIDLDTEFANKLKLGFVQRDVNDIVCIRESKS